MKNELTAERARELLDYDPETGEFRWKVRRGRMRAGSLAGHRQVFRDGSIYRVIRIEGALYLTHRLAWLLINGTFPEALIKHRNDDTEDDRFENLLLATNAQRQQNARKRVDNRSGFKGVSWDSVTRKWVARIRVPGGEYRNLGRFHNASEAHQAYCASARDLFGEFARAE